jgi:transglutaminase-like putative cysteine protease
MFFSMKNFGLIVLHVPSELTGFQNDTFVTWGYNTFSEIIIALYIYVYINIKYVFGNNFPYFWSKTVNTNLLISFPLLIK